MTCMKEIVGFVTLLKSPTVKCYYSYILLPDGVKFSLCARTGLREQRRGIRIVFGQSRHVEHLTVQRQVLKQSRDFH